LFGKVVSDLQSGVEVGSGGITGTLKYVADYTAAGFDMDNGHNFLALHITGSTGSTLYVKKDTSTDYVQLGSDGLVVLQITDAVSKVQLKAVKDGVIKTTEYTLDLTLEEE